MSDKLDRLLDLQTKKDAGVITAEEDQELEELERLYAEWERGKKSC